MIDFKAKAIELCSYDGCKRASIEQALKDAARDAYLDAASMETGAFSLRGQLKAKAEALK